METFTVRKTSKLSFTVVISATNAMNHYYYVSAGPAKKFIILDNQTGHYTNNFCNFDKSIKNEIYDLVGNSDILFHEDQ